MRSIASEMLSAAQVLLVPLGIAAFFPYEAIGFRGAARASEERPALAALVTLDEESERNLFRTARMTRNEDLDTVQVRPEVFLAELPEDRVQPMLPIWARSRPPGLPLVECGPLPFLPSRKAAPPRTIRAEKPADGLVFPRRDMLKLN